MHRTLKTAALLIAAAALAGCEGRKVQAFPQSFTGVGLELKAVDSGAEVVKVIAGGPAESGGVKTGDVITAIDDAPIDGLPLENIVEKLRGPAGSQVSITTMRVNQGKPAIVILRRESLKKGAQGDYQSGRR
jgi:C-terminal processing protease CtpA/Prc